jgi:hypothetical protein
MISSISVRSLCYRMLCSRGTAPRVFFSVFPGDSKVLWYGNGGWMVVNGPTLSLKKVEVWTGKVGLLRHSVVPQLNIEVEY